MYSHLGSAAPNLSSDNLDTWPIQLASQRTLAKTSILVGTSRSNTGIRRCVRVLLEVRMYVRSITSKSQGMSMDTSTS